MIKTQNDKFEIETANYRHKLKDLNTKLNTEFESITKKFDEIHVKLEIEVQDLNTKFEFEQDAALKSLNLDYMKIDMENERKIVEYIDLANAMIINYNMLIEKLLQQQLKFKKL
jgi:hypothetical protein